MRRSFESLLLVVVCATAAPAAPGPADPERLERLERRLELLERRPAGPDWLQGLRLGAQARAGWFDGGKDSLYPDGGVRVQDLRLLADQRVADALILDRAPLSGPIQLSLEWQFLRAGQPGSTEAGTELGDVFLEVQELARSRLLNIRLGRFQLPVGEGYLRFGRGEAAQPFVTHARGVPWFWDEGLMLWGDTRGGALGYRAAVTEGHMFRNHETDGNQNVALKLLCRPVNHLELSISGDHGSGLDGSPADIARSALWQGEMYYTGLGTLVGRDALGNKRVANYQDGRAVADGPPRLASLDFLGADAIVTVPDRLRLWLAGGRTFLDIPGGRFYDRQLDYAIAETVFEGAWLKESLRPFYLGLRADAFGTFDAGKGYILDNPRKDRLGYNVRRVLDFSGVLGWRLAERAALRAQYTRSDIDLVRGVDAALAGRDDDADLWAVELGLWF